MKNVGRFAIVCLLVTTLSACKKNKISVIRPVIPIRVVAVASLAISDYSGTVSAGSTGSESAQTLVVRELNRVLTYVESKLKKIWKIRPVSEFVKNGNYQKLGEIQDPTVSTPIFSGEEMAVFSTNNEEMKTGFIAPEVAKKICSELKVDAVIIMFTEWIGKSGSFILNSKPVTKNVFTMWDRAGNLIFKDSLDKMGQNYLDTEGEENSFKEWSNSTSLAFDEIISKIDLK